MPLEQPLLQTPRLVLRPFELTDGPAVRRLAGAWEIADTTLNLPHPYPEGAAEEWIATHRAGFERGAMVNYAVTLAASGELIGAVGLTIATEHRRAELGYWIAHPYWNRGYATEAAAAVLRYAFGELGLNRIQAMYFARNPASGRVLEKLGMRREGLLRQYVRRWEACEDTVLCALLCEDFFPPPGQG